MHGKSLHPPMAACTAWVDAYTPQPVTPATGHVFHMSDMLTTCPPWFRSATFPTSFSTS
ncbi:hypothetical protein BN9982_160040 [Mycobacterium tuberculosis]|nr:hypothetical protein BN9982_160040 [Mycobacterium tuberculosis]